MSQVDGDEPVRGAGQIVQVDETFIGGYVEGKGGGYTSNKTIVIGMLETGGKIITKVIESRKLGPI